MNRAGAMTLRGTVVSLICGAFLGAANPASAMPGYARIQGLSCLSCHEVATNIPKPESLPATIDDTGPLRFSLTEDKKGKVEAGFTLLGEEPAIPFSSREGGAITPPSNPTIPLVGDDPNENRLAGFSGYVGGDILNASLSLTQKRLKGREAEYFGEERPTSVWVRVGFTPKLGPARLSLGLFGEAAQWDEIPVSATGFSPLPANDQNADSYGMDAAINGELGFLSLDITAMYQMRNDVREEYVRLDGRSMAVSDRFSAAARVGINRRYGLSAGYQTYRGSVRGAASEENVTSVGAWINVTDDARIESLYTLFGDKNGSLSDDSAFTLLFLSTF